MLTLVSARRNQLRRGLLSRSLAEHSGATKVLVVRVTTNHSEWSTRTRSSH
jgi:hypothetical protein